MGRIADMPFFNPANEVRRFKSLIPSKAWQATKESLLEEGLPVELTRQNVPLFVAFCMQQWQRSKGIYKFDDTLLDSLQDSDWLGLPSTIYRQLPEWGIYIDFPIFDEYDARWCDGAFCAISQVSGNESVTVGLALTTFSSDLLRVIPVTFPISEAMTVRQMMPIFNQEQVASAVGMSADAWDVVLSLSRNFFSLAAYLCTSEPDIRNPREPRNKPNRHVRNNGPVRHWEVGYRFGAAFRKQLAEAEQRASTGHGGDERNRPRVHVRRAHWHSFWTGPKEGERKLITKWLPPTIVNAEGGELPATIWRQK